MGCQTVVIIEFVWPFKNDNYQEIIDGAVIEIPRWIKYQNSLPSAFAFQILPVFPSHLSHLMATAVSTVAAASYDTGKSFLLHSVPSWEAQLTSWSFMSLDFGMLVMSDIGGLPCFLFGSIFPTSSDFIISVLVLYSACPVNFSFLYMILVIRILVTPSLSMLSFVLLSLQLTLSNLW